MTTKIILFMLLTATLHGVEGPSLQNVGEGYTPYSVNKYAGLSSFKGFVLENGNPAQLDLDKLQGLLKGRATLVVAGEKMAMSPDRPNVGYVSLNISREPTKIVVIFSTLIHNADKRNWPVWAIFYRLTVEGDDVEAKLAAALIEHAEMIALLVTNGT